MASQAVGRRTTGHGVGSGGGAVVTTATGGGGGRPNCVHMRSARIGIAMACGTIGADIYEAVDMQVLVPEDVAEMVDAAGAGQQHGRECVLSQLQGL